MKKLMFMALMAASATTVFAQEELDNTTTSNETSAETTLENTQETSE